TRQVTTRYSSKTLPGTDLKSAIASSRADDHFPSASRFTSCAGCAQFGIVTANMKRLTLLILALTHSLFAGGTDSVDALVGEVKAAFAAKDAKRIEALIYDKGMSESDRKLAFSQFPGLFLAGKVEKIETAPLDPDTKLVFVHLGKKYSPTYQPIGTIVIHHKLDKGSSETAMQYAAVAGKYYLVTSKSEDLKWKGPADTGLSLMITGGNQDLTNIKVKYNQSGVNGEESLKYPSFSIWGQYIDEVSFTSTKDDYEGSIIVSAAGKEVARSEVFHGKGNFKYKRK
ncbi:MAG: hypothetical protein JWM68_665, partial [Verrucomicrobiales bacterium]|nr:hypothetical protein [Verrucomicrobiales bacterium]